ncbi:hypothetical protein HBB16_17855 [Pseudonocardia sp. MCCB 268]|nr:hypothetical protein [Pseudonocardia cytotoxica]
MTQVMPFALSLGIIRRHFYADICLLLAAETLLRGTADAHALAPSGPAAAWGSGWTSSRRSCRCRTRCCRS